MAPHFGQGRDMEGEMAANGKFPRGPDVLAV